MPRKRPTESKYEPGHQHYQYTLKSLLGWYEKKGGCGGFAWLAECACGRSSILYERSMQAKAPKQTMCSGCAKRANRMKWGSLKLRGSRE